MKTFVGTIFLLVMIIVIELSRAITSCHSAYSCQLSSIIATSMENVECYGYYSCYQSSINASRTGKILCYGAYSCFNSSYLYIDRDATSQDYKLACHGLFSCAFVKSIYNDGGTNTNCFGELSCYQSNISAIPNGTITCDGDRSCANATVTGAQHNYIRANFACYNAILNAYNYKYTYRSSVIKFYMDANNAGYGATIICGDGIRCLIYCNGNACNNLTLVCHDHGTNNCSFEIDCSYAEKSDICPNGYQLPFILPSLFDHVQFSTYDNSYNPCVSSNTNAINCHDYNECDYNSIDINTTITTLDTSKNKNDSFPICCTAANGCIGYINITNKINLNSTINIHDTAIRCDGHSSCKNIQNFILAKNGGNVYFTGGWTTQGSSNVIIKTRNKYNIVCTGHKSCIDGKTFTDAFNLLCMGAESCSSSTLIEHIVNVYGYGKRSLEFSTIRNIFDSVYCSAYQACYSSNITNVNNTVYGGGYQVLYGSRIFNVKNVYCGGLACCSNCSIRGSESIIVSGTDSLSNSVVFSQLDSGQTMVVIINGKFSLFLFSFFCFLFSVASSQCICCNLFNNCARIGTNNNEIDVYCNITNICKIKCLSNNSCTNLHFHCFENETCFVDCDQVNGINCPSYSLYGFVQTTNTSNNTDNREKHAKHLRILKTIDTVTSYTMVAVVVILCIILIAGSYHGRLYFVGSDKPKYTSLVKYIHSVIDLWTDFLFVYAMYLKQESNYFYSSLVFAILPQLFSAFSVVYWIYRWDTMTTVVPQRISDYLHKYSTTVLILFTIFGDFGSATQLAQSKLFFWQRFNFQLTKSENNKLYIWKFFGTTILENLPQLCIQTSYVWTASNMDNTVELLVVFSIIVTCLSLLFSISTTAVTLLKVIMEYNKHVTSVTTMGSKFVINCNYFQKRHGFTHYIIEKCILDAIRNADNSNLFIDRSDIRLDIQVFYIHNRMPLVPQMNVYFQTVLTCYNADHNEKSLKIISKCISNFGKQGTKINQLLTKVKSKTCL